MKKFFALLVSLLMVLGLVAIPAFAEGEATFSAGTATAKPGDDVVIPVSIDGDFQCHGLNMEVLYDAEKLTVTTLAPGALFNARPWDATPVLDKSIPGHVKVGVICPTEPFTGSGVICNITFHVADDCTEDVPLEVVVHEYYLLPVGGAKVDLLDVATCENGLVEIEADTPVTEPPVTEPPVTEPPVTEPPVTEPPVTEPPVTEPPVTEPPVTEPPVTEPPVTEPPATDEPVEPIVTDEPAPVETTEPAPGPKPPVTGAASLIGLSIVAIAAGAGIVIFRKKED
ncbi:MAG: hypothetical protein IKQ36_04745 [Clostridia bacterium]|nr:hypothetical protein [Clostridia bacterium]